MAAPTPKHEGITLSEDRGAGHRQLRAITSSNRVTRILPSSATSEQVATEFNRLNFDLAKIERMVYSNPYSVGILFKDVPLINGNTTVEHKLGKKVRYEIKNMNGAAAAVFRPTTDISNNVTNTKSITLTSNAAVTVDILIVPEP